MGMFLLITAALLITGFILRWLITYDIRNQLRCSFPGIPDELQKSWARDRIWHFASRHMVTGGTVTLNTGQALYHLSRIDPRVLEAVDRIHDPADLNSYRQIAAFISNAHDDGQAAWDGAVSNYKGAVGEQVMAERLRASGHVVEMADSTTQEGWDAIVDGEPINFKCGRIASPDDSSSK